MPLDPILDESLISILSALSTDKAFGRELTPMDYLAFIRQLTELTQMSSTEPLLPLLLSFNGSPLTLQNHFALAPLFLTDTPIKTVLMNGRQTGKSVSVAASLYINSVLQPNLSSLYITPLQEQMKRFSINYMRGLIDNSPFRSYLTKGCTQTITQRSFTNESRILFSFASVNADRVRGINADVNCYDEIQDFSFDILPVIAETLSASMHPRTIYTGTPKTEDNTLAFLWRKSSQAEWWIPCEHCGFENIPSRDYHLEGMIGPSHDEISEDHPAVICYKCGKPVYPRKGRWVHRYPERRMSAAHGTGYHVPQIIMPMHYANKLKWETLLAKQRDLAEGTFWNEVLGEPMDAGQTLVSTRDLQAAGCLGFENDPVRPPEAVFERLTSRRYQLVCMATDWAGGGQEMTSFTVTALLGIDFDGNIDCLWGKRFSAGIDHYGEAKELLWWCGVFKPHMFVHDYTGAGSLRETIMVQNGMPLNRIMGIQYGPPSRQGLINCVQPTMQHPRKHWIVDKSRGLLYTIQALKVGKLRFFTYDGGDSAKNAAGISTSLMDDFLSLVDEKMTSQGSNERYLVRRIPTKHDDFAQACMMGCVALWHNTGMFPNFAIHQMLDEENLSRAIVDAGPVLE